VAQYGVPDFSSPGRPQDEKRPLEGRAGAIFFISQQRSPDMGNKIVTEADRKATKPLPGSTLTKQGVGQKRSLERGSATRSKKNPGKRAHQG
jgi:hypothetical protein